MIRCRSCSAPLALPSSECAYCGTRNDVDLAALRVSRMAKASGRICPDCDRPMVSVDVAAVPGAEFHVEQCETCFGLFFDAGELDSILDNLKAKAYAVDYAKLAELNRSALPPARDGYRKCPVCGRFMNRVNPWPRSGVVADECRGHGTWLDAGELKRLTEWRGAGGLLHKEEVRRREEKARELREKEQARRLAKWRREAGEYS